MRGLIAIASVILPPNEGNQLSSGQPSRNNCQSGRPSRHVKEPWLTPVDRAPQTTSYGGSSCSRLWLANPVALVTFRQI